MAFTTKRRSSSAIVRRSPGSVSKAKFSAAVERAKSAGKRLRDATKEDESAMVSVGTGLALAVAESKMTLPTIAGIDPLVLGGVLGYAVTRKGKSKTMGMARDAAIASLTIGVNRSYTRGSVRIGEDDEEDDTDPT